MDEGLEAAEPLGGTEGEEGEGMLVTLLHVVGLLMIAAGVGLGLLTSMGLLWAPALLVVVGVLFLTVPGIAFELLG